MALTINQNPQRVTPSDNPITWVFTSDQYTQPNFYFLIEVEVANPTTFTAVERHKIYPELGGKAHFDATTIASKYAEFNDRNLDQVLPSIRLTITEYYNSTMGATVTTNEVLTFKSRLNISNFVGYDFTNYYLDAVTNVKYLTLEPRGTAKVKANDLKFLSLVTNGIATTTTVNTYDSSNVLIDTINITSGTDNFITLSVGVQTLIDGYSLSFTNAEYYTIETTNGTGTTEVFRIDLDNSCQFSTSSRLHFLNTLGGVDSYTFGLLTREKTNVTSFGYERQFGSYDSSGNYSYNLKDGTVIDYLKQFNTSLEITSDWMSATVQNWLSKELYTSPIVWIQDDIDLNRCKVTNKEFTKKIQENDMLIQEVAEIELNSDNSVNV